jgi:hypothetical protein
MFLITLRASRRRRNVSGPCKYHSDAGRKERITRKLQYYSRAFEINTATKPRGANEKCHKSKLTGTLRLLSLCQGRRKNGNTEGTNKRERCAENERKERWMPENQGHSSGVGCGKRFGSEERILYKTESQNDPGKNDSEKQKGKATNTNPLLSYSISRINHSY